MISSNSSLGPGDPSFNRFGPTDGRGLLLTEVDFKWLMAGQGWWINTKRLHSDAAYAAGLVGLALASPCAALRECAALLRAQREGHAADELAAGD
ncbi:hypothetical protein [Rhodoferax sp.]|uniref:hypothetical protein n=1 Tax=Rhodoferax sp. TaxID=50421 RepID=UPI002743BA6C|nr:hypothetical protein [Rhodoferax sp.]